MRILGICLLIFGLATFSKGSEDQPTVFDDSEDGSVENYDDLLKALEKESIQDDLPKFPQGDLQDASSLDFVSDLLGEDSGDSFDDASLESVEETYPEDDMPEISDAEDAGVQEDSEDAGVQEDSEDAFNVVLREAFKTWNAEVKACDGDVSCFARVNNVLRPIVNEAEERGAILVIEPCEDRVGTYEVETVDGWTIEAVLPCST